MSSDKSLAARVCVCTDSNLLSRSICLVQLAVVASSCSRDGSIRSLNSFPLLILTPSSLWVCVHVHVCVHMCLQVHVCMHGRSVIYVTHLPQSLCTLQFGHRGFSVNLELASSTRLAGQSTLYILIVSITDSWAYASASSFVCCCCFLLLWFYIGSGDQTLVLILVQ